MKINTERFSPVKPLREIDLPSGKRGMQWRLGALLANIIIVALWSVHVYEATGQRLEFYIQSYGEYAHEMILRERLLFGSAALLILHLLLVYLVYRGAHQSLGAPRSALKDGLIHAPRLGVEPFLAVFSFIVVSIGSIGFLSDLAEARGLGLVIGGVAILVGLALNLISPIVVATSESGILKWPFGPWLPVLRNFPPGIFSRVEVVEFGRNGYTTTFRIKAISTKGHSSLTVGAVPAGMGRFVADSLASSWTKVLSEKSNIKSS